MITFVQPIGKKSILTDKDIHRMTLQKEPCMTKNYKLEICANSVTSCIEAEKGGAWRVELCAAIPEGGTTPSYGDIALARELLQIKLHVIIRPRGGDFLYSPLEHRIMLKDIEIALRLGADGVVIGCLTSEGEVDMARNRELVDAAAGMSVTFHRAFDMCHDPFESLERIIELGCDRLLTSGHRIIIMPGSGVNANNIAKLAKETGASEFHLSARVSEESGMVYRNPNLKMGGNLIVIDEYTQQVTRADKVAETLTAWKDESK